MSMGTDWEHHRTFLAVLTEGSLSGASRALGLAQPTVRRRIEGFEQRLGTKLFTRTQNGLEPTEIALALEQHAQTMASVAEAFERSASAAAHEVSGIVRISASEIVAVEVLPAILAPLREQHPGLVFALSPSNRNEDLLHRESDIAIRMARPAQQALVARRIGAVPIGLYARRDWLESGPLPTDLIGIAERGLIGPEHDNAFLRAFREQGINIQTRDFAIRTDSDLAQLAAVRAGLGIGVIQVPLAARDPALVRLIADQFEHRLECWVVTHEDLRATARIRATYAQIVAGMDSYLKR